MSKLLLTLTGPSGSGKTSVLRNLLKDYGVGRVVTCTTRAPRDGEVDGVDYHFLTVEEYCEAYSKMIAPASFAGNNYGIIMRDIFKQFEEYDILAIIVEPEGADKLKFAFRNDPDICVHNIYINIDPKKALSHMARRDGWSKAKKRQKADFEGGLYYGKFYEIGRHYDCIIGNDRKNTIKNMARDIMNYVEAQIWTLKMKGSKVA